MEATLNTTKKRCVKLISRIEREFNAPQEGVYFRMGEYPHEYGYTPYWIKTPSGGILHFHNSSLEIDGNIVTVKGMRGSIEDSNISNLLKYAGLLDVKWAVKSSITTITPWYTRCWWNAGFRWDRSHLEITDWVDWSTELTWICVQDKNGESDSRYFSKDHLFSILDYAKCEFKDELYAHIGAENPMNRPTPTPAPTPAPAPTPLEGKYQDLYES